MSECCRSDNVAARVGQLAVQRLAACTRCTQLGRQFGELRVQRMLLLEAGDEARERFELHFQRCEGGQCTGQGLGRRGRRRHPGVVAPPRLALDAVLERK